MDTLASPISIRSLEVPLADIMESQCGALYAYWDGLRGDRWAPGWGELQLIDLPAPFIPFVYVVDVLDDPFDLKFRFWGTGLTTVFRRDHTGETMLTMDLGIISEERRDKIMDDYRTVIKTKAPFLFIWDTRTAGRGHLAAPAIRLPLSDDGETVTKVICGFDFSENREQWKRQLESV